MNFFDTKPFIIVQQILQLRLIRNEAVADKAFLTAYLDLLSLVDPVLHAGWIGRLIAGCVVGAVYRTLDPH